MPRIEATEWPKNEYDVYWLSLDTHGEIYLSGKKGLDGSLIPFFL